MTAYIITQDYFSSHDYFHQIFEANFMLLWIRIINAWKWIRKKLNICASIANRFYWRSLVPNLVQIDKSKFWGLPLLTFITQMVGSNNNICTDCHKLVHSIIFRNSFEGRRYITSQGRSVQCFHLQFISLEQCARAKSYHASITHAETGGGFEMVSIWTEDGNVEFRRPQIFEIVGTMSYKYAVLHMTASYLQRIVPKLHRPIRNSESDQRYQIWLLLLEKL